MSEAPLVTIITPTYNHKHYISDCIQSAVKQTFESWEMIIINDGSTDGTAAIARELAEKDHRITFVEQDNVGIFRLSETYNRALNLSRGKYIAILEGDDMWEPTKLECQVKAMENDNDIVVAWGKAYQINEDNTKIFEEFPLVTNDPRYANIPTGTILDILFYRDPITALTMLIKKSTLVEIGGFKQGFDLPTVDIPTLQVLATKGKFYFDNEVLGRWRVYPNQTTKTHIAKLFEGHYLLSKANIATFSENKELTFECTEKSLKKYFDRLMISIYSRAGRYKLIKKQFKEARKDYIKSILTPGGQILWKVRSIVGLVFSLFHQDIESLAKILKRPSYKK